VDRTWTLTIADYDRNGITGTLTAWSITVTPQGGGGTSAAGDMTLGGFLPAPPSSGISADESHLTRDPPSSELDTVVSIDETTFFATPADSTIDRSGSAAAVDAVMEELDLDSLSKELVGELVAGLL
jgi:hypothetical protein